PDARGDRHLTPLTPKNSPLGKPSANRGQRRRELTNRDTSGARVAGGARRGSLACEGVWRIFPVDGQLQSTRGFMTLIPRPKAHECLLALAVLLPASTASAQDYLGSYLQSQQDANIREIQQDNSNRAEGSTAKQQRSTPTVSPSQLAEVKARLRTDYERRVREEGQAKADEWLRDTAHRIAQSQGSYAARRTPASLSRPGRNASYRKVGAPDRIRTCGPRIRNPMLYPAVLRTHAGAFKSAGRRWQSVELVGWCYRKWQRSNSNAFFEQLQRFVRAGTAVDGFGLALAIVHRPGLLGEGIAHPLRFLECAGLRFS